MKKIVLLALMIGGCAPLRAQNIEGQIIASEYAKWRVPGYAANTYSSFAPGSCRVQGGASFFFAFSPGTAIQLVDANPALTETVVPSAVVNSNVTCAISIAPVHDHQLPFYFGSATGGLQEALNQNLTNPQANTVILDNTFYQTVGGAANVATVIAAAQGNANLGLIDITQVPTVWYRWNGTQYVRVGNGGVGTGLNTLVNDLVSNNSTNSGAQDLYDFVATGPSVYSPQAAVNAATSDGGSVILQPGVGRTPFTNTGNVRVVDNRSDVPATARVVTEFGAACDLRQVYGTLTAGSTTFSLIGGALTSADVGRHLVAALTGATPPIQFDSVVVSITDSLHGVLTTEAPFSQIPAHEMDLAHDDTAAITQGMNAVGAGGTLVFPAGYCLTHTQALKGQSPIGLGINSQIVGFPGEDIFQAPDPSTGQGVSQGAAHIHDLTFLLDSRIDATQPWQTVNDSGTITHPALYRPIAHRSAVANDPLAPGWFQGPGTHNSGAYNGVASITAGSAVMCVPNAETAPPVSQVVVFPNPGATLYWRLRSSYNQQNWSNYLVLPGAVSAGLQSSAATAANLSLNQSNYATVDSIAAGATATVRVYGSGGAGTAWASVLGNSSKLIPAGTILNIPYGANGFVVWDGEKYQLKPQLAQTFPDNWIPVGKVSVIANASGLVLPTIHAVVTGGAIVAYQITNPGNGLTAAPILTITDSTGSGATATAVVSAGAVTQVTPGSAGSGYSGSPTVTASGGVSGGSAGGGGATGNNGGRLYANV